MSWMQENLAEALIGTTLAGIIVIVLGFANNDMLHARRVSAACAKVGGVVVSVSNGSQFCAKVEPLVWEGR